MSVLLAFMISTQPVLMANLQAIPLTTSDCRTVFIPMNFDQPRQSDKRVRGKIRPTPKPQPNSRPCFTRAST